MKANAIICALDMFGFDQIVMISKENEELIKLRTNMNEIGKTIATASKEYGINNIQFYGSKEFCKKKIIPQVYESFGKDFDLNEIIIEVN